MRASLLLLYFWLYAFHLAGNHSYLLILHFSKNKKKKPHQSWNSSWTTNPSSAMFSFQLQLFIIVCNIPEKEFECWLPNFPQNTENPTCDGCACLWSKSVNELLQDKRTPVQGNTTGCRVWLQNLNHNYGHKAPKTCRVSGACSILFNLNSSTLSLRLRSIATWVITEFNVR